MSYWIEYRAAAFVLPADALGRAEPRFVIAIEGGPNNVTTVDRAGRERRARDWHLSMIGTRTQVLRQAVMAAACCEGGSLKPLGRSTTPEAYIGRIRRLLRTASVGFERHVTLSAKVPEGHPLAPPAEAAGYVIYPTTEYGEAVVKLIPPQQTATHWAAYFDLIDPHLDAGEIDASRLGQIWGLPAS